MAEALRTPRVVVVGAGIGGLVSALLLAQRGLQVTLVEAAAEVPTHPVTLSRIQYSTWLIRCP